MVCGKGREEEKHEKNSWLAIATLLAGAALFGGTITVTQPAGGNVAMGGTCPIAWTASNVAASVKIQLVKPGGALVGVLANNLAAGGSPWNWTVASPAVVGQQYKIRVRAVDGSAEGESAVFTVVQGAEPVPGSISNVKLSGSSPYCLGTNYTISWTVTGVTQHLKLELIKGGARQQRHRPRHGPGTSSKDWTAAGTAASDYKVRVSAIGGSGDGRERGFRAQDLRRNSRVAPRGREGIRGIEARGLSQVGRISCNGVKLPVVLPGVYQNYPGHDTFPRPSPTRFPSQCSSRDGSSSTASGCGSQPDRQGRDLLVPLGEYPGRGHLPFAHHFLFE